MTLAKTAAAQKRPVPKKRAPRGLLLEEVTFKREYRCFAEGFSVKFRPGVNLLVGEQGCGKSTLLSLVFDYGDDSTFGRGEEARETVALKVARACLMRSFDFERANPRTLGHLSDDIGFQIASKFRSHGETVQAILRGLEVGAPNTSTRKKLVVLLDEPDMALSPRSAHALARTFAQVAAGGNQIIAAVHNPIVIASQPDVLSLEHGRWMPSEEFLSMHADTISTDG